MHTESFSTLRSSLGWHTSWLVWSLLSFGEFTDHLGDHQESNRWHFCFQSSAAPTSIDSSKGCGTRAVGWFIDYFKSQNDSKIESLVLTIVKGWVASGERNTWNWCMLMMRLLGNKRGSDANPSEADRGYYMFILGWPHWKWNSKKGSSSSSTALSLRIAGQLGVKDGMECEAGQRTAIPNHLPLPSCWEDFIYQWEYFHTEIVRGGWLIRGWFRPEIHSQSAFA